MTVKQTIELPRLPDESARAYAARVEYVTMGEGRSLEKLSQKSTKNIQLFKRWSVRYGWQESARQYDEQVAYLTIQEAAEKYRADLLAHRKRAMEAAQGLYAVAGQLTVAINKALAGPREIIGNDGKKYTLHKIDLTAATFQAAMKGMQTALDLEAHALALDTLLPKLTDDSE